MKTLEEQVEECLDLLHECIQHTPLKLSETDGSDYNKGYIFYQDMVVRDVLDNTPRLKAMVENIALTAEKRGMKKVLELPYYGTAKESGNVWAVRVQDIEEALTNLTKN